MGAGCSSPSGGGARDGAEAGGRRGGCRGGRGAAGKARGAGKVWFNFPLPLSPISPSCKTGFSSVLFI